MTYGEPIRCPSAWTVEQWMNHLEIKNAPRMKHGLTSDRNRKFQHAVCPLTLPFQVFKKALKKSRKFRRAFQREGSCHRCMNADANGDASQRANGFYAGSIIAAVPGVERKRIEA